MSTKADEFEATRQVVATLEPFDNADRERILRWARDKLGMQGATGAGAVFTHTAGMASAQLNAPQRPEAPVNIRSFIDAKNPRTDSYVRFRECGWL